MATKIEQINGIDYEFVKEVASDTRVKGWFVKMDKVPYVVLCAPIPRLYDQVSAYTATRAGHVEDLGKPLFTFRSSNIQDGVDKLITMLAYAKQVKPE
jgi:hypothetical protein